MPRTFDSEDFDIHKFERQKPDVYPVTREEKIDSRVLKDAKPAAEPRTKGKLVVIGIIANVFLPGLGNVFIKKTVFGALLLLLNLALLAATLSPISMLGFLGNLAYPAYPSVVASGLSIVPSAQGYSVAVDPAMAWLFYLASLLAIVTWLHFFYIALKKH